MKAKQLFVATLAIFVSSAALAAKPPTQSVDKWTCGDFVELDETYQPNAYFLAEGFTKSGTPVGAVLDVDATETVVPKIVAACKEDPKSSFVGAVKKSHAK
ncbi:acid-activated periplasmic chaperone HdeA [Pseudomonas sp. YuFO20]|uniref:Acid-activated periplasmic chaperone HdeA n=1 Tax=Pseudomonas neuropathica TaxID=2730425 RepID=A0ACC7MT84_9PSED|nr:acid-activated periplasmic chaperone HdeA [Pseudomonas sp. YuFO20]MEB2514470.1 acid-activated periplasmic chaperone HdeA [Pseudomonas sp. YuFO20]